MTITFYKITDDKRQVSKTLNSTTKIKDSTGTMKTNCNIMDPVIEMSYDATLLQCNYLYIPEFSRYYFITRIEVGAQRMYLTAHVDVLQTYSTQIRALTCVIERQEDDDKAELYLTDKAFRAENRHVVSTRRWDAHFSKDNCSYVLTTGGRS